MKATFKKLEPGSKINIWILGRKAEAIFEKYIEESGEVTFTHKGRDVTLDVDMIDKIESAEKVLHIVLMKRWYRMIEAGEKPEEYREFCTYWIKRLCDKAVFDEEGNRIGRKKITGNFTLNTSRALDLYKAFKDGLMIAKEFDVICFHNGYTSERMYRKFEGLDAGFGKPELGAPDGVITFIIKVGSRLER